MIPFDSALFKAPNFSVFDHSHDNKLNMGLGDLVPVYWKFMHPNERITTEVGNLVRMQPLNGAILQHYDITFDTFFVPCRLIFGREKSERFFNLYQPNDTDAFSHGGQIPVLPWDFLLKNCKSGTLLDYLGYPTFVNFRAAVSKLATTSNANGVGIWYNEDDDFHYSGSLMDVPTPVVTDLSNPDRRVYVLSGVGAFHPASDSAGKVVWFNDEDEVPDIPYVEADDSVVPYSYYLWLLDKAGLLPAFDSEQLDVAADVYPAVSPWPSVEDALKVLSVSPEKSVEMYFDYLVNYLLYGGSSNSFDDFASAIEEDSDQAPSVLPIFAYWRIVSDWYMNYNLSDMPEYELYDYIKALAMPDSGYDYNDLMDENSGTALEFFYKWRNSYNSRVSGPSGGMMTCFKRNWANDYFTSAFRSPQSGNAVPLPSSDSASIVDLRRANILQELYERVLYAGRKYRDQVRAFFNVVPANSRMDVSEVISREVQNLQISEVTQTNQADYDSMLESPFGSFGGQSQTIGTHKLSDYTSDEHGVFMVLASIRPKAAYFQGVRKELLKTDVYDFLWPQMENIGEQEIVNAEIFADFDLSLSGSPFSSTFGWQRRYAEFMYHPSEVHGDLQNSLDYLHAARKFEHLPKLNVQFGEIRAEDDDLNRVFVYSADARPFIVELYFDSKMIRPLSRYLHYDL